MKNTEKVIANAMKKNLALLLTVALLVAICLLTACGNETDTTDAPDTGSTTATATTTTAEITENPVLVTAYDEPEKFVTLPDFAEITVSKAPIQEEVDKYLDDLLSSMGREDFVKTESGTAAIQGDSLNIHYTGRAKDPSVTLSADTLKGMTNASDEAGYDLVLGSGSFIPGFEDQLIGAKEGDTVTVDVTFPENYSPELSNVAVLFEVTVNSVNRCTVSDRNSVVLSVEYAIKDNTASDKLAAFIKAHEATVDLTDSKALLDKIFPVADFKASLLGLNPGGKITFDVTMPVESAEEYGYNSAIALTATVTVEQVIYYPTEITDEDINKYTGGDYKTAEAFKTYVFNHYKSTHAYKAVIDAATFAPIPTEVYDALYKGYYDNSIYKQVGDISGMTEEELAEVLTETVKKTAEEYATTNAKAEYEDRMLVAYLKQKLSFTLSEEKYQELLKDLYDYYMEYYYISLIYSGITDIQAFESFYGKDNLIFQFTVDELVTLLSEKVTLVD